MSQTNNASLDDIAESRTDLFFLKPSQIEPDIFIEEGHSVPFNVRKQFGDLNPLTDSIRSNAEAHGPKNGVETPLRGYYSKVKGKFLITDGERRWRASLPLEAEGFEIYLPCRPEPKGYSLQSRLTDMLVTQTGKPLTMLEQARGMERLLDSGMNPKEIATRTGYSITHIQTCLALLCLPEPLIQAVEQEELTPTLAVDIGKELKAGCPHDIDTILTHARKQRDESESDHITAKHLPILVGKPAVAARSAGRSIDKEAALESTAQTIYNVGSEPGEEEEEDISSGSDSATPASEAQDSQEPHDSDATQSTPGTVPFQGQILTPDTATTDANGYFISGIQEIPLNLKAKGVKKGLIRIASRVIEDEGKEFTYWYYGFRIIIPGQGKGEGFHNCAPNIKDIKSRTRATAVIAAISDIIAAIETAKPFPSQAQAIEELRALERAVVSEMENSQNSQSSQTSHNSQPAPPTDSTNAGPASDPAPDPATELCALFAELDRASCDKSRYDTTSRVVKFLKGKTTTAQLAKYIMGVSN